MTHLTQQDRWLFERDYIRDTARNKTYDRGDVALSHNSIENAVCIWHKGKHVETVSCSSELFYGTLYQYRTTEHYLPMVIERLMTDTDENPWTLGKGFLRRKDDETFSLGSLALELNGSGFDVYAGENKLCTLPSIDGDGLMRAKANYDAHRTMRINTTTTSDVFDSTGPVKKVMLTTEVSVNLPIDERVAIITAEAAYGMNAVKDYFTKWSDKLGGRNSSIEGTLKDAREQVLSDLKEQAMDLGCNGVVGVDLDFSEFSGGGKSMLFVVGSGTAVKIGAR